jgi:hypothetical protein
MIVTYVKLVFAAAMMLAQPVQHDYDRGHVRNGVAVAWSHDVSSRPVVRSPEAGAQRVTGIRGERPKPAAHARVAKQAIPISNEMPRAKIAPMQPAGNAAAGSDTARPSVAGSPLQADAAAVSNTRTIQQQVTAATAVAEQVTAATAVPAPEQKANHIDRSDHSETARGAAEKTAAESSNHPDDLVAILMARPEIKSVSDLTNKIVAIDDRQSASNASLRTAIVAAGATEIQLSDSQTRAIERVINGEVPAAVLTLVSPEAAEGFPDIAGFKVFRIPLSPRSLKARDVR